MPAEYPQEGAANAPENRVVEVQVPSNHWVVVHGLGFNPGGVRIEDYAGTDYEGFDVTHVTDNELHIDFEWPISGYAILS